MNFELLKTIKSLQETVYSLADTLEKNGWVELGTDLKFRKLIRMDIAEYILYVIAADDRVNIREVDIYRFFTDYGGDTIDSLVEYIEKHDIASYKFQSEIPLSLKYLVTGTNDFLIQYPEMEESLANFLLNYFLVFAYIGKEIMRSDMTVSYAERRDVNTYLSNLYEYIRENSYLGAPNELRDALKDALE